MKFQVIKTGENIPPHVGELIDDKELLVNFSSVTIDLNTVFKRIGSDNLVYTVYGNDNIKVY